MDIQSLRKEYRTGHLFENEVDTNPLNQFRSWLNEAISALVHEPNAMVLSTVDNNKIPHSRVVLLKDCDDNGLVFYTNYLSNKGMQLSINPNAALLFFWPQLERQVRIEGHVKKVDRDTSVKYFYSRPVGSQLGAMASPQSQIIKDRKVIEDNLQHLEEEYKDKQIPLPETWGGYILEPVSIEFWQGRPNRLHDRILYSKLENALWSIGRLAP